MSQTHASRIRDWLSTQDGPRTIPEITAGLGLSQPDGLTAHSVHRMHREGMLSKEGRCRAYRFAVVREPAKPLALDEKRRRANEAQRKRWARLSRRTRAQYLADIAANKAARLAEIAAAKAQRKADREAERAQRQAEQKAAREAARATRATAPRTPRAPRAAPVRPLDKPAKGIRFDEAPRPAPQPVPVESVEDFIRRGGRVIRLAPGQCAQPLRIYQERQVA